MAAVMDFLHVLWDRSPELIFDLIKLSDLCEVESFLISDYFPQLPLSDIIGLNAETEIRPWLAQYLSSVIVKNVSVIVRDTSQENKIVAVSINDLSCANPPKDGVDLLSFSDPSHRPKWTAICELLRDLYVNVDFDPYDPVLSFNLVGVAKNYAHRGLATKLIDIVVKIAKGRRIRLIKNEVVNEYLANAHFEAGFIVVKQINYQFYSKDGRKPFVTDSVHNKIRLMVKIID